MVREDRSWPAASVLRSRAQEARRPGSSSCDRAQARRDDLARAAEEKDYAFARPAFTAMKLRKVALKAGAPREYGKAGPGRDYWIKEIRHRERDYVERAERAYERMVAAWKEGRLPGGSKQDPCADFDLLLSAPSVVMQIRPSSRKRVNAGQRLRR